MQAVSSAFHAASIARVRRPRARLEIAWDGANFVNESENIIGFSLNQQGDTLSGELFEAGVSATGHIVLRNRGWRYSAFAAGGDGSLRNILAGGWSAIGKKLRLSVGFDVGGGNYEYCRILTGYITDLQDNAEAKMVTLSVQDNAWLLLQRRQYSGLILDGSIQQIIDTAIVGLNLGVSCTNPCVKVPYAWFDDDPAWGEVSRFAAATGNRVWFDAYGVLHCEHDSQLLIRDKVFTYSPDLPASLHGDYAFDKLLSDVVVEYAPRRAAMNTVLYVHDKLEIIRPGETKYLELRLSQPSFWRYALENSDYYVDNGSGMDMRSYVQMTIQYAAQRVLVGLTNTHAHHVAYLRFLQVRGRPLVGSPSAQVRKSTSFPPIPRTRSVRGNEYVQTAEQAQYLAEIAFARYSSFIPTWIIRGAPGLPHLELYDVVGFYDNRVVGSEREGIVIGIEHNFGIDDGSWVYNQNITVLDSLFLRKQPGETTFVVGESALGAGVCWF